MFLSNTFSFSAPISFTTPSTVPQPEREHYIRYPPHHGSLVAHRAALKVTSVVLKLKICTVTQCIETY